MNDYRRLNEYYKDKFGERVLKISIDGGFTCPNRDGKKGHGGCIFCGQHGSGVNLKSALDISSQVKKILDYKKNRANKFIVYFQNFTNTYADISTLKERYDSSLVDERIIGIDIDTRPDEINEEVCKLLSSYKEKYYVLVELGLQTVNEKTHSMINQNITNANFDNALYLLNKYDIDVVVHIMVGLPNETHEDIVNIVNYLNKKEIQGIKIHSTYVLKDTILAQLYLNGEYNALTLEEYVDEVVYILTHIKESIIIHRITGDPPKDMLIAPLWSNSKKKVLNSITKIFKEQKLKQGIYKNK